MKDERNLESSIKSTSQEKELCQLGAPLETRPEPSILHPASNLCLHQMKQKSKENHKTFMLAQLNLNLEICSNISKFRVT